MNEHARYRRVVPEIAARAHVRSLRPVIQRTLDETGLRLGDIGAVTATTGPGLAGALRVGLTGALRVGLAGAKGLAYALGIPPHGVRHIAADTLEHGALPDPCMVLIVSDDHTSLLLVSYGVGLDREGVGEPLACRLGVVVRCLLHAHRHRQLPYLLATAAVAHGCVGGARRRSGAGPLPHAWTVVAATDHWAVPLLGTSPHPRRLRYPDPSYLLVGTKPNIPDIRSSSSGSKSCDSRCRGCRQVAVDRLSRCRAARVLVARSAAPPCGRSLQAPETDRAPGPSNGMGPRR